MPTSDKLVSVKVVKASDSVQLKKSLINLFKLENQLEKKVAILLIEKNKREKKYGDMFYLDPKACVKKQLH